MYILMSGIYKNFGNTTVADTLVSILVNTVAADSVVSLTPRSPFTNMDK